MNRQRKNILPSHVWLLVLLVLAVAFCWAGFTYGDTADDAIAKVQELRAERDTAQSGIAELTTNLADALSIIDDVQAELAAAMARIAELEAGTPQPPATATVITAAPSNPVSYKPGDATQVGFTLDGVLAVGDRVLLSAYNKTSQEVVGSWTHSLTAEPITVPSLKLDALPTGPTVLTAGLLRGGTTISTASHVIDIVRVSDNGDDGTRTTVSNLQVQAGQTYRNLIVKGGVRVVWKTINNVTFENCDFRDAAVLLTVQARDDGSAACSGWTFRNCTFKGATRSDWGHSQGTLLLGVKNFHFEDCVWEHNGWIGSTRFNQNHDCYLDARRDSTHPTWAINENISFLRCQFIEAAAQGVKMRGILGLTFKDCLFRGNLIDLANDMRSPSSGLVVENCLFENTGGTDSINLTYAWSIHLKSPANNPLSDAKIVNCRWIGPGVASGPGWSGSNGITLQEAGVLRVEVINADWSKWRGEQTIKNQIGNRLEIR